jgi:hypothetical protein
VQAAASPFEHVGNFTVLNGAEGVTGALAQIIQQAGTLSTMAREALMPQTAKVNSGNGTGHAPATPAIAAAASKRAGRPGSTRDGASGSTAAGGEG